MRNAPATACPLPGARLAGSPSWRVLIPRFLLVAPRPPWDADFSGLEGENGLAVTRVAPAAIATVAALAPPGVEPVLHDESLAPLDLDTPADFVGLTANVAQLPRALELAAALRARGRFVIVGGPHVTLEPGAFEGVADTIVTGEFEGVAGHFYRDMLAGRLRPQYDGGRPDIATSPAPAWELYDNERALIGVAQTSRGCPFECNFCDVIQYVGRAQRHKTNEQVLGELRKLYALGYNIVQIADDNFAVYRRRSASLLEVIGAWNGRDGRGFLALNTQVSLDVAADDRILALCAEAGFTSLFIGVETVNEESLRASGKRQNLAAEPSRRIANVVRHGMDVVAALMVGFDADGRDIFERQEEFAQALPVGTFKISALSAPAATPLHDAMAAAGRLVPALDRASFPSSELATNILPAQMSREQLYLGTRWLISRLFRPDAFAARIERARDMLAPHPILARAALHAPPERALSRRLFLAMMRRLSREHPQIRQAVERTSAAMRARPEVGFTLQSMMETWLLSLDGHLRRGSYSPVLAAMPKPPLHEAERAA